MLLKKNRADKKDIQEIFKNGRFFSSPSFDFKFLINKNLTKISIVVPKKILKTAVARNSLRRLGYKIIRDYLNKFPNLIGVFLFKKKTIKIEDFKNELEKLLTKIN